MPSHSGSIIQTLIKRVSFNDFLTEANTTAQSVPILRGRGGTDLFWIMGTTIVVTESWAPSVGIELGIEGGDTDIYQDIPAGNAVAGNYSDPGIGIAAPQITVTTVGSNTGTSGAGLSLIGDTSTTDQSGSLMNDLVALQEDVSTIASDVAGGDGQASYLPFMAGYSDTGGMGLTLTTGTAWSIATSGEAFVLVNYINVSEAVQ